MENPFELIINKLDVILKRLDDIERQSSRVLANSPLPATRIPLKIFCEQHSITRPTVCSWNQRKLIKIEKIGGRCFVIADSIVVDYKYQREPGVFGKIIKY